MLYQKQVPLSAYIYIICFTFTNTQSNYAVTHPLFNYMFQIYLCSIGKVRNASDADISVIFP